MIKENDIDPKMTSEPPIPENANVNPAENSPDSIEKSPDEKTFTQADIDDIISKRLSKERASRDREIAALEKEHQKQLEIDKLSGEEKLRAQYESDIDKIKSKMENAQHELSVSKVGNMLAKRGLDPEFAQMLAGDSDDESRINVENFAKMVSKQASEMVKSNLNRGAPSIPENNDDQEKNDLLKKMREYAGLPAKK